MEESNIMQEHEHVNVPPPTPASSNMGVRKRKWGKFASKIRDQGRNIRIWLGTYEEPQMAATACDIAAFHLKGRDARLNFPDMIEKLQMSIQEYKIST
ncbi:putative transcription factor AP2-EREBP family [Medicago truncatula]|uniref:AP2 domain class transcription factor n=1 Tax=Medicago truncatula TaxID=3880 RepID=G7K7X5_MEDTR|nr:AP2 domain class transcription factor [Medicago truncatula]RHN53467.1 putative transcription factor AP2-EREBP family [Medicago truncatula]